MNKQKSKLNINSFDIQHKKIIEEFKKYITATASSSKLKVTEKNNVLNNLKLLIEISQTFYQSSLKENRDRSSHDLIINKMNELKTHFNEFRKKEKNLPKELAQEYEHILRDPETSKIHLNIEKSPDIFALPLPEIENERFFGRILQNTYQELIHSKVPKNLEPLAKKETPFHLKLNTCDSCSFDYSNQENKEKNNYKKIQSDSLLQKNIELAKQMKENYEAVNCVNKERDPNISELIFDLESILKKTQKLKEKKIKENSIERTKKSLKEEEKESYEKNMYRTGSKFAAQNNKPSQRITVNSVNTGTRYRPSRNCIK